MPCPNTSRCELYSVFVLDAIANIWKIRFCDQGPERHGTCERYKLSQCGDKPPKNLLPNGKYLETTS